MADMTDTANMEADMTGTTGIVMETIRGPEVYSLTRTLTMMPGMQETNYRIYLFTTTENMDINL